jgi:hypothetical protein
MAPIYVLVIVVGSFPLAFRTITYMHSSFIHSCYTPYPPHPHRPDNSNDTWRRVQIMKLLVMQFSPPSRHFIPLRPNILLSTLFSDTLSPNSSFSVRDQFSPPYRTIGKIIISYILISVLSDGRREDEVLGRMAVSATRRQTRRRGSGPNGSKRYQN